MKKSKGTGLMKKIWISVIVVTATLGAAGAICFSSGAKASAVPAVVEDIQYPFEKGGGLVNVAIKDVLMGVGMLTGDRKKGDVQTTLTGSINFELISKKAQARLQVDRIRLIEHAVQGKKARIFEAGQVRDMDMEKGLKPDIWFLKEEGRLPFVWENGRSDCIYFIFSDIPSDLMQADLIITYNGKFPDKRHTTYYENRFSVKQKTYFRNR